MARGKKTAKILTPEEKLKQALVPVEEQPYPIPENWRWVRFQNIVEIINGFAFKSDKYVDKGIRIIRITNVQDGYLEDNNPVFYPLETKQNIKKYILKSNDLLVSLTGNVGRIAFLTSDMLPAALNQRVGCLRSNNTFLKKKLLFFYMSRQEFQDSCIKNSKGTAQLNMSTEWLKKQCIPIPPLPEQERIVARIESLFAKLNEAKEKAQAVVDGFELRKAAILHKAFTGELAGISSEKTIQLEAITDTIRIGPFGSILHKEDYITGGIPVINPKHIVNQQIIPEEKVTITEKKASDLMSYRLKTDDIIMGRRGEMGRSAPVTEKENGWLCGTGSLIIRLQDGYIAAFYSQIIASHSSVQYLEENCVGSTMKNLNEKVIKGLPVPNYTKKQQKEIIAILDSLLAKEEQAKEIAEAVLAQIDIIKKAILARAFRGELGTNDLTEESAEELLKTIL